MSGRRVVLPRQFSVQVRLRSIRSHQVRLESERLPWPTVGTKHQRQGLKIAHSGSNVRSGYLGMVGTHKSVRKISESEVVVPKHTLIIMPDGLVKVNACASGDASVFDPDLIRGFPRHPRRPIEVERVAPHPAGGWLITDRKRPLRWLKPDGTVVEVKPEKPDD